MRKRTVYVWVVAIVCFVVLMFVTPAIPQNQAYHDFADTREFFGIPNTLNVVSNFPFLVIGVIGLVLRYYRNYFKLSMQGELWGWTCFYIGVAAVAFGSAYYHLKPNDTRLVWDRLPMTIAFTSVMSIFIIERIDERKGTISLIPLLMAGIISILYWSFFDDLRSMADQELDPSDPSCLHLVSAFLAMDSTESLISLSRVCGGGSVTEGVQRFIWDHCLSKAAENFHAPYLKNFLKKLIAEIELNHDLVLDELYEQYAYYMTSLKDDNVVKGRICKCISFLFPAGKLVVPLRCSLNMLDGDTGCALWPSSLFLSEFILSFPGLFSNKSCFEVGSGVGLVGICLAHVEASKFLSFKA